MIVGLIVTSVVGIVLVVMGYFIWKKEKISLLHDYHYDKVSQEDKKVFCTISGIGILSIGISLLITAVILGVTNSALSFIAFVVGFVLGIVLLIYAGNKYNSNSNK